MNRMACFTLVVTLLIGPGTVSSQRHDQNGSGVLRQGSNVRVRLPDNLDSDRNRNGDEFEAVLDRDLASNGRVLARAGSVVFFKLVDVMAGGGAQKDRSRVSFTLTGIQGGSSIIPIVTNTITIGTAPNRNQVVNFRTERSTNFDGPGDQPEAAHRNEPGSMEPFREPPRGDNRLGRDRDSERGAADRGAFHWRGRVDGSDYVQLRRDQVIVRHVKAQPISGAHYDVSSPLPKRPVTVRLNRLQGRGRVTLYQQPSAANNYTVSVYIEDHEGGNDLYEFELVW